MFLYSIFYFILTFLIYFYVCIIVKCNIALHSFHKYLLAIIVEYKDEILIFD